MFKFSLTPERHVFQRHKDKTTLKEQSAKNKKKYTADVNKTIQDNEQRVFLIFSKNDNVLAWINVKFTNSRHFFRPFLNKIFRPSHWKINPYICAQLKKRAIFSNNYYEAN